VPSCFAILLFTISVCQEAGKSVILQPKTLSELLRNRSWQLRLPISIVDDAIITEGLIALPSPHDLIGRQRDKSPPRGFDSAAARHPGFG
jgi:hypothetical protein